MLARHAEVSDLPSPEDVETTGDQHIAPFNQLLGRSPAGALQRIHEERCDEATQVAIVYGAGHMPAVVRYLGQRFGYWASDAEWMTIFDR